MDLVQPAHAPSAGSDVGGDDTNAGCDALSAVAPAADQQCVRNCSASGARDVAYHGDNASTSAHGPSQPLRRDTERDGHENHPPVTDGVAAVLYAIL